MTVVREGKIRTALSIHQTAGYVTTPSFYGLSSNSELLLASPSFKIKKKPLGDRAFTAAANGANCGVKYGGRQLRTFKV